MFVIHQAVVKAMELLALEGKIKEKVYGKQKIYFADQVSLFSGNTVLWTVNTEINICTLNNVCYETYSCC